MMSSDDKNLVKAFLSFGDFMAMLIYSDTGFFTEKMVMFFLCSKDRIMVYRMMTPLRAGGFLNSCTNLYRQSIAYSAFTYRSLLPEPKRATQIGSITFL